MRVAGHDPDKQRLQLACDPVAFRFKVFRKTSLIGDELNVPPDVVPQVAIHRHK